MLAQRTLQHVVQINDPIYPFDRSSKGKATNYIICWSLVIPCTLSQLASWHQPKCEADDDTCRLGFCMLLICLRENYSMSRTRVQHTTVDANGSQTGRSTRSTHFYHVDDIHWPRRLFCMAIHKFRSYTKDHDMIWHLELICEEFFL